MKNSFLLHNPLGVLTDSGRSLRASLEQIPSSKGRSVESSRCVRHQGPHPYHKRHHRNDPTRRQSTVIIHPIQSAPSSLPEHKQTHSHRLQDLDPRLGRDRPSDERQERRPCLPGPGDPADAAREEPRREDPPRMAHHEWVHGPEEHADARHRDGAADERGDEPDDDLEPVGQERGRGLSRRSCSWSSAHRQSGYSINS